MHLTKLCAAHVLNECAYFQRTPKKSRYKVLKLICTNVFKLKLICCNCFAVIAYMIIKIEVDFNLKKPNYTYALSSESFVGLTCVCCDIGLAILIIKIMISY